MTPIELLVSSRISACPLQKLARRNQHRAVTCAERRPYDGGALPAIAFGPTEPFLLNAFSSACLH